MLNEQMDLLPVLLVSMKLVLAGVCILFLISGLDDLLIDIWYGIRWLYRRIVIVPRIRPLTKSDLLNKPEQAIAVMLPAWDEAAVIRPMLERASASIHYSRFHFFVGTYPNDSDTQQEVERIERKYPNVHKVVTPNDGPTNKADCLNWIYQGIRRYEKQHDERFEIFIMQDCEDVIHPLCYKLFNYLIPRKDMVQLPVHSLRRRWYQFTAGHYIDEFAQLHVKDLVVRESFSRTIPAAGVGVAFSRRALETLAAQKQNQLFNIDSLTEDYDFGFRLHELGLKQIFARVVIPSSPSAEQSHNTIVDGDLVCVREYFPQHFRAAVRQKSRWVVGIALQGWATLGWRGDWRTKYMLFRDRKALLTNLVNLLGYLVAAVVLVSWARSWLDPESYRYPPLLERDTPLWYIVLANACLFVERVTARALCVYVLYGGVDALLSLPRMVWGNIINFFATCRAIRLYLRYLWTGKLIAWDKTAHLFPCEEELPGPNRRLGDILLERKLITPAQLQDALHEQRRHHRLLGEILVEMGVLQDRDLNSVLYFAVDNPLPA